MGVAAATIKSKFELAQPPRRFGYLYNAVVWALFPGEHAIVTAHLAERYTCAGDASVVCLMTEHSPRGPRGTA